MSKHTTDWHRWHNYCMRQDLEKARWYIGREINHQYESQ